MATETLSLPTSAKRSWAGIIVSATPVLFLLMDTVGKFVKPAPVVEGMLGLGYQESVIVPLGIVLLASTILYIVPKTSVLGAILLTRISAAPSRRTCAFQIRSLHTNSFRCILACFCGSVCFCATAGFVVSCR